MEDSLTDDEGDFIIERLQNRKIRLELGRLNTLKLIKSESYEKIFSEKKYIFGNNTPPSNSHNYNFLFINSSKDFDTPIDYSPHQCPICFDIIWRDTDIIECFNCNQIFCNKCYSAMRIDCEQHEKNLQCPMCRAVLLEYFNDVEMPRNPLHIDNDNDIENQNVTQNVTQNINQENDRRHNNSLLYLFLMILILILLVIIIIGG